MLSTPNPEDPARKVENGLARARATSQLLHRGERLRPVDVVRRLLAVQAQDPRAMRLALRARIEGLEWDDVDDDALVVGWLMRGTLHLVHRDDYPWLLALTGPTRDAASARRLRQLGVSEAQAERAVRTIAEAVGERPHTRAELEPLMGTEGQQTPHLLALAARRGLTVMDTRRRFIPVLVGEVDRDQALDELARRYAVGHSPANAADLAHWSGLPKRDVRLPDDVAKKDLTPIPPRLLPAFDPYLLGWKDRSFAVPPELAKDVHPGGGMIRPCATVDGVVVPEADERFAAERADVERFLSGARPAS